MALSAVRYLERHPWFRFSLVGGLGFLVDAGLLLLLLETGLNAYLARLGSFAVAVTCTFFLNCFYTFAAHRADGEQLGQLWVRYVAANSLGMTTNYLCYSAVVFGLGDARVMVVSGLVLGSAAGLLVNFTLSKRILGS